MSSSYSSESISAAACPSKNTDIPAEVNQELWGDLTTFSKMKNESSNPKDELKPLEDAPDGHYAGWSPLPGRVPPVQPPMISNGCLSGTPFASSGCSTKRCIVPAQQPVIPVPVYQEIQTKERIIEIPQIIVSDKVIPKLYCQDICYEVPKLALNVTTKKIHIPRTEFREKIIEVPVPVGYKYKIESKWNIREVPKIIPKYTGPQSEIYVEVPQVQIVEKIVEKEIPVYLGEKVVPKEVIEEEPVEIVQYRYVMKEEEIPVYKYTPVLDLEVDIPPPLVLPILVKPTEVQLQSEKLTLAEWKNLKLGGASKCCNVGARCGPNSYEGNCSTTKNCLFQTCQPGGVCSPSGRLGSLICNKPIKCCDSDPALLINNNNMS